MLLKSKAPVSQLVNADDTSVIETKITFHDCKLIPCTLNNGHSDAPIKKFSRVILFKVMPTTN